MSTNLTMGVQTTSTTQSQPPPCTKYLNYESQPLYNQQVPSYYNSQDQPLVHDQKESACLLAEVHSGAAKPSTPKLRAVEFKDILSALMISSRHVVDQSTGEVSPMYNLSMFIWSFLSIGFIMVIFIWAGGIIFLIVGMYGIL